MYAWEVINFTVKDIAYNYMYSSTVFSMHNYILHLG